MVLTLLGELDAGAGIVFYIRLTTGMAALDDRGANIVNGAGSKMACITAAQTAALLMMDVDADVGLI